jgi:FkbM family methyltransferase
MTDAVHTRINGQWELYLPPHRAARPEWETGWERERLDSMHKHLGEGDVIIDVGAEEGDLPALWATWGCEVVLVEPNARVWPNIRAVWEMNELPKARGWFRGFAADTTDVSPPNRSPDDGACASTFGDVWPLCAFGEVIGDHGFSHLAQESDAIPRVKLDDLCEAIGVYPTAITMDVEGSELRVLRGAHWILKACRPLVWVSVHTDLPWMRDMYPGEGRDYVLKYMSFMEYRAEWLATDHEEHWLFTPKERA